MQAETLSAEYLKLEYIFDLTSWVRWAWTSSWRALPKPYLTNFYIHRNEDYDQKQICLLEPLF